MSKESEDDKPIEGKKKGPGLLVIILGCFVAAGGAAAGGYFLTSSPEASGHDSATGEQIAHKTDDTKDDHGADKKKKKKKSDDAHGAKGGKGKKGGKKEQHADVGGSWKTIDDNSYFSFNPLVISITSDNKVRHLKISLVIKTPESTQVIIQKYIFEIQDILNSYLRSIEISQFENPAAMQSLRQQIVRRIEFAAPDAIISDVLITEFILT